MTHFQPRPIGEDDSHDHSSPDQTHSETNSTSANTNSATSTIGNGFQIVPQDAADRPAVYAAGDLYTFLATLSETNKDFGAYDFFVPVGGGPAPHIHSLENEAFYVLNGPLNLNLGVSQLTVPTGSFLFGPKGRIHGFNNVGLNTTSASTGPNVGGRLLSITDPGGLEVLFRNAAVPVTDRSQPIPPPNLEELQRLQAFFELAGQTLKFWLPGDPVPDAPDLLPYKIVVPDDANLTSSLGELPGLTKVYRIGELPKINDPLGISYSVLASYDETGQSLEYKQFSLAPQGNNASLAPISSEHHENFYVRSGELTLNINGQTQIAGANTFVHIAPGNTFSIANQGSQAVEALAVSIPLNRRSIFGTSSNDDIKVNGGDAVIALDGDDRIVANVWGATVPAGAPQQPRGGNYINGNQGNDYIVGSENDILHGGKGDDVIISQGSRNVMDGQLGNDILYAGNGDVMIGGDGADQFWIVNGAIAPIPSYIADFQVGVDKIGIQGLSGITSFSNLVIGPSENLLGTIIRTSDRIPLAIVDGALYTEITANDIVFA
ncbi:MAG TPA: cupin domain-containing protein [Leptolyngbyaceae cyanobacterium]